MRKLRFVNAQKMAIKHPDTFEAPTKEELKSIKVGSIVKVNTGNERFWTIVTKVKGQKITATVDNDLVMEENEDLTYGTVINFKKEHVYDVYPEQGIEKPADGNNIILKQNIGNHVCENCKAHR